VTERGRPALVKPAGLEPGTKAVYKRGRPARGAINTPAGLNTTTL
jgi:hypothetical protein